MGAFENWKKVKINEGLGDTRTPPNLPRVIDSKTGNELSTDAGRTARNFEPRFRNSLDKFKTKISEIPVPRNQDSKKGFGHLGSSVFQREAEKPGENPTLSNGIPVGYMKGQFEANAHQQHSITQRNMLKDNYGRTKKNS